MNKIITLALGVVASLAANAGVFFWQVATTGDESSGYQATTENGPVAYTYAMLKASSDESGELSFPTYFDDGDNGIVAADNHALAQNFLAGNYFTDYGSATVNSIWIELYNGSNLVAESGKITGDTLQSLIAASEFSSGFQAKNNNAAAISSFSAVPEPTSGLMLLIGAAMLGLRRKKVA